MTRRWRLAAGRRGGLGGFAAVVAVSVSVSVVVPGVGPRLQQEPAVAQARTEQRYRPPAEAPVIDPFRPPAERWGPGNRGLEYGTPAGTPVRAIGPGVVTFAGPVAGSLHLTIGHPDGLRSSYSGVAAIRVSEGDRIDGGQVVAVSAVGLHLGVRSGDSYVDPASLWGMEVASGPVVLVPVEERPRRAIPPPERVSIARTAIARALARLPLGPWVG